MITPLVPNLNHLKEILFRVYGSSRPISPFAEAISSKSHIVGRHRFSALKNKDQSGKWTVPGFSGFLLVERYRIRLIVFGERLEGLSNKKKINRAHNIVFKEKETIDFPDIIKRIPYKCEADVSEFLNSLRLHMETSIKLNKIGSFIHQPEFLNLQYKNDSTIEISYREPACDSTLLNWEGNFKDFCKGMRRVAYYLMELRNKNLVHQDVKRSNILVHNHVFFLSDFKHAREPGNKTAPQPYFAWCSVKEICGITIPFTDVYGWAITFGCWLWDLGFYEISKNKSRLNSSDLEKEVFNSLSLQQLVPSHIDNPDFLNKYVCTHEDPLGIQILFYRFLKEILQCDRDNLKHYQLNPDKPNPPRITLEQCIAFTEKFL